MKKEDLIVKWLDFNLDEEELKAFKQLDASSAFMKINQAAQYFRAPDLDVEQSYHQLSVRKSVASNKFPWKLYLTGIAAAMLLSLGVYLSFYNTSNTTFLAQRGEKTELVLPDASEVILNANSRLSYNEKKWQNARNLKLEGEAYFKVSKGSKFTVETSQGVVSVLGTQFDVNARDHFFEVVCYEGLVQVVFQDKTIQLPAGKSFMAFGNEKVNSQTARTAPAWLHAKSSFTSVPFFQVIEELERQYNITVQLEVNETNVLYTGSFTHENLETALQAITIPLNLSYTIKGNSVVLKPN